MRIELDDNYPDDPLSNQAMSQDQRSKAIALAKSFKRMDIGKTPAYQTMVALKDSMINSGIPEDLAIGLASSLKIQVSKRFVRDTEVFKAIVSGYAQALSTLWIQAQIDFPGEENAMKVVMNTSAQTDFQCDI